MRYTVTSRGSILGHTGAELSGLAAGTRGWHFIPAPAFEPLRPALMELQRVTSGLEELMPTVETLAAIREEERPAFIRHAILSDARSPRFLELMDEMEALAMTLHDDSGVLVPTRTLGITELDLSPEAFRDMLLAIDPGSDPAPGQEPPFYLLVAGI